MSCVSKFHVPAALVAGALAGWLAASGHLASLFRHAGASARAAAPAACCEGRGGDHFTAARAKDEKPARKPNIVFIMGDDIGWFNVGAYHRGMMSGKTP